MTVAFVTFAFLAAHLLAAVPRIRLVVVVGVPRENVQITREFAFLPLDSHAALAAPIAAAVVVINVKTVAANSEERGETSQRSHVDADVFDGGLTPAKRRTRKNVKTFLFLPGGLSTAHTTHLPAS